LGEKSFPSWFSSRLFPGQRIWFSCSPCHV